MTRRSRIAAIAAITAVVVLAVGWRVRHMGPGGGSQATPDAVTRTGARESSAPGGQRPGRTAQLASPIARDGEVTIAGKVIDVSLQQPVGGVEVVFRSAAGENTTTSRPDGSYALQVPAGAYRAFVRDDTVLSIGRPDLVRLPSLPSAETASIPDEALMATVVARHDLDGVDLTVVRGGVVAGRVVDRNGRPIAAAVLRARGGGMRPTLATDVAESDATGSFELRLPAGSYALDVSHPKFAGVASPAESRLAVAAGDHLQTTITLIAGCMIAGRVVGPDGKPAGDGALEKQWGEGLADFTPAGRIEPDGAFRWATTDEADITLRAWPWKSPPSPGRRFTCRDGARFDDVVFQLPDRRPDIEGVLVDKAGDPVGFAYVDLAPLDGGGRGIAQQERSDASGRWQVFSMPPGRYRVVAQAEGRGIASAIIVSPRDGVRLELGGTGRLEGSTTRLATGSFELITEACSDATGAVALPQSRRLVTVTGGRFTVDDLPACELAFAVIWRGKVTQQRVAIPGGGTAHIEFDLGAPRAKTVHGVVRDSAGQPVAGAIITSTYQDKADTVVHSEASGAYTIQTFSGAALRARASRRVGFAQVGGANVDAEQVDLVVVDDGEEDTDN